MAYTQLTTRTTSDTASAADVNQLQTNIEALKGGAGAAAPTTTIEGLVSSKLAVSDVINDLTTGGTAKALSAEQGKTLKALIDPLTTQVINTQTASYVLALTDVNKIVEMNVTTANTLTVPKNTTVDFPIGTRIDGTQEGTGVTTITAAADVTIHSEGGALILNAQYAGFTLYKRGTNDWRCFGSLKT